MNLLQIPASLITHIQHLLTSIEAPVSTPTIDFAYGCKWCARADTPLITDLILLHDLRFHPPEQMNPNTIIKGLYLVPRPKKLFSSRFLFEKALT